MYLIEEVESSVGIIFLFNGQFCSDRRGFMFYLWFVLANLEYIRETM